MGSREQLLETIVDLVADYREEDGMVMDMAHVDRWIRQFPDEVQEPMLAELAHVFERTYIGRVEMEHALSRIATESRITGGDHAAFWRDAGILKIQKKGASQSNMLEVLDMALQKSCGASIRETGSGPINPYIYMDDFVFSGGRVWKDIKDWIGGDAPQEGHLIIFTLINHLGGENYADHIIHSAARRSGKRISVQWLCLAEAENRNPDFHDPDVLMPTRPLPDDPATKAYVDSLRQPWFRQPGQMGGLGLYSSDEGRTLLEHQFLLAGIRVLECCPLLRKPDMRPLGYSDHHSMGFGSLFVTYRNCPNSAPLALWAGHPWYPLFPRKTN